MRCRACCWVWGLRGDHTVTECAHCGATKDRRFSMEGDQERVRESIANHKTHCIRRTR